MLKQQKRSVLAPEVVQSSNMDCGPAALKSILQGFGVNVSYGRLREACQTDVDGTSIDTLEDIALQLGMDAEQVMIPHDHIFIKDACALPALIVIKLANGCTHFVVAWAMQFNKIQLMDPATGRRWVSEQQLINDLYIHTMAVPADGWREWAGSDDFIDPLKMRIQSLGASSSEILALVSQATVDEKWLSLGFLDAATRMMNKLVVTKGIDKGEPAVKVLLGLFSQFKTSNTIDTVPKQYWSVQPDSDDEESLLFKGAVLVKINGCANIDDVHLPESEDLRNALTAKEKKPFQVLLDILDNGYWFSCFVISAILLSSFMVLFESLLFRGLIDVHAQLKGVEQRLFSVGIISAFLLLLILIEYPIIKTLFGLGRQLENKFRILFLEKLPRINDRYFQSRPRSDMAERSHQLYTLRQLPNLIGRLLQNTFHLLATIVGIIYLVPSLTPWLLFMVAMLIAIPFAFQPFVSERDLRVKTHTGALSHFYLDALLGLIPIRANSAEKTIRQEHESLQREWSKASNALLNLNITSQAIQAIISTFFIIILVFITAEQQEHQLFLLLLVYWLMNMPQYTNEITSAIRRLSSYRNVALRAVEPLGVVEDKNIDEPLAQKNTSLLKHKTNTIKFNNVSVKMGGHSLLEDIDLTLAPGEHVAIVGRSGAGKSSIAGLLLGWLKPVSGNVLLDGHELVGHKQKDFCQKTAWVDPAIQLWNTTFFNNLNYGQKDNQSNRDISKQSILNQADLMPLLTKFSDGLQTPLGDGGGLVSGGEGQRIRLGRAMGKAQADFVILDEPFRGLDRKQRHKLLNNALTLWHKSTLLFISHDISETLQFSRVIVIDEGKIVEDSTPKKLASDPNSQYSKLLQAENTVQDECWSNISWRRLSINNGELIEDGKHE